MEVIKGPITGLPIPAHAEIAIEGEVPPPSEEARDEGPFGEWPGYYSGGTIGTGEPQPVIRVKAVYHRNQPVIDNEAPLWPGTGIMDLNIRAALLWDQMENAGIQDLKVSRFQKEALDDVVKTFGQVLPFPLIGSSPTMAGSF